MSDSPKIGIAAEAERRLAQARAVGGEDAVRRMQQLAGAMLDAGAGMEECEMCGEPALAMGDLFLPARHGALRDVRSR
jgi:hypothetical protein